MTELKVKDEDNWNPNCFNCFVDGSFNIFIKIAGYGSIIYYKNENRSCILKQTIKK